MHNQFSVFLHIQNSIPVKAKLYLGNDNWSFDYTDQFDGKVKSVWVIDNIQRFQNPDGSTTFKHLQVPFEAFETNDPNLLERIKTVYNRYAFARPPKRVNIEQWQLITAIIAILLGTIALLYFWLLPAISIWAVDKIPLEKEIQLGKSLQESFLQGESLDKELTELTQQFADSIDFNSKYPLKVSVINDTILNAFALPGGYIVIYSKMLQKMESYDQLAALLSHEATHIINRHSLHSIANSLSGLILIKVIFGNITGLSGFLVSNLNEFKQLNYSRNLEHEADENGLKILAANNINQKGMIGLFNILKQEHKDSLNYSFLQTHPLTDDRIKFATKIAATQKTINAKPYLENKFNNIQKLINE